MFDFNYTEENGVLVNHGYPDKDQAHQYGMVKGWTIINNRLDPQIDNPALYESEPYFSNNRIRPLNNMIGIVMNVDSNAMKIYGMNPPQEVFNPTNPDSYARGSTFENLSPHCVTEFPFVVYWDVATSRRLTDLSSVLNDYAEVQFAQFVTGARPLSDMNNYFAELDRMGYQEYLKYFTDYYDKVRTDR
jgi:hypothetical protein